MSQPPYGAPPPDPGLPAPVDPYQSPAQPGYSLYPDTPGYPSPTGYPETSPYPVSGYPGQADPAAYQAPGYPGAQGYQQPAPAYPGGVPVQPYPGAPSPYQQAPQYQGGPQYPGYPGYPPAQQGGGGGRTAVVVLVVVLLVVVVAGGIGAIVWFGSHGSRTPNAHGSGTPSTVATSASPSPKADTHTGDLRTYLMDAPSGSRPWSKPLGTNGKLSLDEASALSSNASTRKQMLTQYNFTQGAVQCWIDKDGVQVDVRLYQFDTADDALGFYNDDVDATESGYDSANVKPISGVPNGKSFGDPKKDSQGYTQALSIGVNGDTVIVVDVQEKGDLDITVPNGIFSQQYGKL